MLFRSWNGKYVTVRIYDEPVDGMEPGIYFNGSKVKKVIKTNNAYIYDLEDYINTPKALMEYLKDLPDEEYSIFKEMVLSRTQRVFDKAASTPIGIDKTGNTVYDSVFTEKSQYFADKKLDLYSENITATLLVPSNDLIENALKYADDGVKIQIEITRISQGIQIKVKDNGWGIAPKYQKKLFNQYYQVPREALRMRKGYGIGLAYVRHIIRAHGGKIQFKSRENEGSVFTFYIPEK